MVFAGRSVRDAGLLLGWLAAASPVVAQGVVNPSLLAPQPDDNQAAAVRRAGGLALRQAAEGGVVYVAVEVDGPRGKFVVERASSGVVVGTGRHVVTWARLVAEAVGASDKRIYVQWTDGARTKVPARLLRSDPATGLALLELERVDPVAKALPVAAVAPAAGLPITVYGCPDGSVPVAFEGVLGDSTAPLRLGGATFAPGEAMLTDARPDLRCDGAVALDELGRVVGLCSTEFVRRDVSEPTLDDLRQPSFLVVVTAPVLVRTFAAELGANVDRRELPRASGVGPVASAAASVVGVFGGDGTWPAPDAKDPGATVRRAHVGSGVAVAAELVVTNNHLVRGDVATVGLPDGKRVSAQVVRRHPESNLALLKVPGGALTPAGLRDGGELLVGERLFALGRPFGGAVTTTAGVLSAVRGGGRLQADPDLGNANAGGAVVDRLGQLVGIADGGALDPLEVAFAMRGDRVTKESNLSTFLGLERVRRVFADELAAAAVTTVPLQRAAVQDAVTAMVEKVAGGLLNVYVGSTSAGNESDNPFASVVASEARVFGLGSGVIVDQSGLALTNWHVVDDAVYPDGRTRSGFAVEVSVFGGRKYQTQVLAISREDDLALLQLQLEPGETVKAIELGNSAELQIGEKVVAIGNPHGKANTITAGIVTAKDQGIRVRGRWAKLEHLIETDAAINGGNSGGALLDLAGRLVGINSAGGGTFNNRGYAISVDHVRRQVLGLLLQAYKLRSPDLGMAVLDSDGQVVVSLVDARGPAAAAGVKTGDRVVSLGGTAITWSPGFARTLLALPADLPTQLVVERAGKPLEVAVVPVAPSVWALLRQTGLACRDVSFAEAPEAVRQAAIARHRKFTGDSTGVPFEIPAGAVRVEQLHAGIQKAGIDLQPGDLLVAVMLKDADTGGDVLVEVRDVEGLKGLFNDRELGSYDGQEFACWIARGERIVEVPILARRLFW